MKTLFVSLLLFIVTTSFAQRLDVTLLAGKNTIVGVESSHESKLFKFSFGAFTDTKEGIGQLKLGIIIPHKENRFIIYPAYFDIRTSENRPHIPTGIYYGRRLRRIDVGGSYDCRVPKVFSGNLCINLRVNVSK